MILFFDGKDPQQKFIRLGVMDDHKSDELIFRVAQRQGSIDLAEYKPWLKVVNSDLTYIDKTDDMEVTIEGGYIDLLYRAPRGVTLQRIVDMQLSFERPDPSAIYMWQSHIFNVSFDRSINYDASVEKEYPRVLQELDRRVANLEQVQADIVQCVDRSYFPNIGKASAIYIDTSQNKAYRYDEEAGNYYIVGTDYDDIKIIKCI